MILDPIFQRFGIDPRDVAGASLAGAIPISDALLNRLLVRRLAGHAHIASVEVAAQDGDTILARIEPRARFVPAVHITARIERQPDLPRDATLWLRWSMPTAGPLAILAGPVLARFTTMPAGVRVDRDAIAIDVRELLRARGVEDVLVLVRRLAVHTRRGAVVLHFEAELHR